MRPKFQEIKSYQEFSQYYWYREELVQICKELDISHDGMKRELNHNIEEYFKGNLIQKKKQKKKVNIKNIENLTLDTPLLNSGFCCNQKFRDFFQEQVGISSFKFNADMVATAKKVRDDFDTSFTLKDMLDVYYGKKEYAKYDNSSCEWNKFLKDFCSDKKNKNCSNKLKVAAILWKEVRTSTRKKLYTTSLIEEFNDKIKMYYVGELDE